jgi:hypothetical protein
MTAVFHGNLSTFSHDPNRRMGYAAIQSQLRPIRWLAYGTVSLEEFDYLSLRLRGDGRTYVVNIQVPGFISEDMFQCFIYTKKIEEQSDGPGTPAKRSDTKNRYITSRQTIRTI